MSEQSFPEMVGVLIGELTRLALHQPMAQRQTQFQQEKLFKDQAFMKGTALTVQSSTAVLSPSGKCTWRNASARNRVDAPGAETLATFPERARHTHQRTVFIKLRMVFWCSPAVNG